MRKPAAILALVCGGILVGILLDRTVFSRGSAPGRLPSVKRNPITPELVELELAPIRSASNNVSAYQSIEDIVQRLTPEALPVAVGALDNFNDSSLQWNLLGRIYSRWGEIDPRGAAASAQRQPEARRDSSMSNILRHWAGRDLQGLIAFGETNSSPELKRQVLSAAVRQIGRASCRERV